MGRFVFKLPDVGEGTAEAEIVAWHVRVGDVINEDQHIVDVMTDKATVEMTSPVAGKIVALHGEPGSMAPVGAPLVEFDVEGAGNEKPATNGGITPAKNAKAAPPPPPKLEAEKKPAPVAAPVAQNEPLHPGVIARDAARWDAVRPALIGALAPQKAPPRVASGGFSTAGGAMSADRVWLARSRCNCRRSVALTGSAAARISRGRQNSSAPNWSRSTSM